MAKNKPTVFTGILTKEFHIHEYNDVQLDGESLYWVFGNLNITPKHHKENGFESWDYGKVKITIEPI